MEAEITCSDDVCKYDGSTCPWGIRGSRSAYRDAMIGPVLGPFFLRTVDLRSSHCRSDESSSQYTSAMANTITGTGSGKGETKESDQLSLTAYLNKFYGYMCVIIRRDELLGTILYHIASIICKGTGARQR